MARRTPGRWRSAPASALSSRPTTSSGSAPRRPCTSGTRSSRAPARSPARWPSFATLGVGFAARPLGGILGGHLGDKVGRKPVLVASLIVMGLATFVDRPAAHLRLRRRARADPAGHGAHHPGPGVRRRMGRGDPDELRARPVATKGQLHRHRPGRFPGRAAAGQPGVLGQRPPRRRLGVAGAVPGQHLPGHRRPDHPRQGSRVAGLRGRQGARRHRQVPDRGGDQGTTGATSCAASACASPRPPATRCRSPT